MVERELLDRRLTYDGHEVDEGPGQVLVQVVEGQAQLARVLVGRRALAVVALRRANVVGAEQHRHHLQPGGKCWHLL